MNEATREPEDAAERHVRELWERFKATGDEQAREGLILQYSPLVKFVAGRVGVGLPRNVEQSDLVSYGIFGLIDAIDKFDLERGIKFETYAISRVKGAILDELRALDWVPRSVRARAREIERSMAELEHKLHRTPTEEELAAKLDMPLEQLLDALAEISTLGLVALDELLSPDRNSAAVGDLVPDRKGTNPEAAFQIEEMKTGSRRCRQPVAGAGTTGRDSLLLRRPDPGRDRECAGSDRVAGLSDPHQVGDELAEPHDGALVPVEPAPLRTLPANWYTSAPIRTLTAPSHRSGRSMRSAGEASGPIARSSCQGERRTNRTKENAVAAVTMKQLLEAGVHFGHQTRRWNPKMEPYIYGERNGIHIVDLRQTLEQVQRAYDFVRDTVAGGGSVLFVGTKKQASGAIQDAAEQAQMPYVNFRWLGGMLTNFATIQKRIYYMKELEGMEVSGEMGLRPKKERLRLRRELEKLQRVLGGVQSMTSLPDILFTIDLNNEQIALREAARLRIPVVALVDTNCDPDLIDVVIPGNDDAIRSAHLVSSVIAAACQEGREIALKGTTAEEPDTES